MLPLFKSHFSIGKSILTLDDPKKTTPEGSDSVFSILQEEKMNKLILVEDTLIGFFEAYKRCKELNIQLIFGLRLSMRNSSLEEDAGSSHKIIVFAKNNEGCKLLNKIYSKAFCEFSGFLDYKSLKNLWDENHLKLAIPFYDSFIHVNTLSFANALPDMTFTHPVLLEESNNLALDLVLSQKVKDFAANNCLPIEKAKSIYYKSKKDVNAFMTYKIICNRSFGKDRTLEKPELPHFCSDDFCFESWKENTTSEIKAQYVTL